MTVSNISCIGNLFEKGFEEKLFLYVFSTSHTKIYSHFLLRRNILIKNFCLEKRVIKKKAGKYFISKKLESFVYNTSKLYAKNLKLSLKEYHEQLFNFSQRKLLYITIILVLKNESFDTSRYMRDIKECLCIEFNKTHLDYKPNVLEVIKKVKSEG